MITKTLEFICQGQRGKNGNPEGIRSAGRFLHFLHFCVDTGRKFLDAPGVIPSPETVDLTEYLDSNTFHATPLNQRIRIDPKLRPQPSAR